MSLQVWLPFTDGTLKQQGLSNNQPTLAGTVPLTNVGKLGKCATFGTAAGGITLPSSSMTSFTKCSIAFWIKIISWNTSYATFFQAGTASTAWTAYNFGILRNNANSNLCFTISNGTTASNASYVTSNLETGIWYHLAFTYKSGVVTTYLNGVQDKTYSTSITPNFSGITAISLGRCTNNSSYQTNCNINDFRIYNNCLTADDVKELARGLVLHYPLNRNGWGQENGIINSSGYNGTAGWSWSASTTSLTVGVEDGVPYFISKRIDASSTSRTFITHAVIDSFVSSWSPGDKFTISGYYKVPSSETYTGIANMFIRWADQGTRDTGFTIPLNEVKNKWIRFKKTFVIPTYDTTGHVTFYMSAFSQGLATIYWKNIKLEYGDKSTPWCPNSSDALATTMSLNGTTEYDCSGFGNNGEKHDTTMVYDSDAKKYAVSTKNNQAYNSSNYPIKEDLILSDIDKITIAMWCKPTVNGHQDSGFISTTANSLPTDYQQTVLNHYDSKFACCNTSGTVVNLSVGGQFTLNEWHHYVFVYDGAKIYFYKDGVLKTSANQSGKLKPITSIFPFYSCAGGAHRTTSGNMNDLRVYVTALSAEDVLALYENRI